MLNLPMLMKKKQAGGGFKYPFPIDYAGKFDGAASLTRTYSVSAGWTFAAWVKRTEFGALNKVLGTDIQFNSGDTITAEGLTTTAVYRDPSHWLHLYVSDNGLYINGVKIGDVTTGALSNAALFDVFDGYAAQVYLIDSSTVAVDSFGEFKNNTWVPKAYTGSYGTNGFHLDFADSGDLGKDVSGNGNHFTNSGVVQTEDTPTNNFPTWDCLNPAGHTVSSAGLTVTSAVGNVAAVPLNTLIPLTGKWQVEFKKTAGSYQLVGIGPEETLNTSVWYQQAGVTGYLDSNGNKYIDGVSTAYGAICATNDIMGIVYDADTGEVTFYKNGVSQGVANTLTTGIQYVFAFSDTSSTGATTSVLNNGAGGFDYPIAGALPICTANWPTPEVIDSEQGLWVNTREGTGAIVDVTGAPFNVSTKSLVWIKNRDAADSHRLVDTVRGATNELYSNATTAETVNANGLTAFLTNGFSLGTGAGGYNDSAESFVDWLFNMLPKYGMDIVSYTGNGVAGRTVAHNLGVAPELMIVFSRSISSSHAVYHKDSASPAANYYLFLNTTGAAVADATVWNNTAPDASVFTMGTAANVNQNGATYIASLFRSVPGFLKVGYYIGNGSADGPRIHTGFRVRYLLIKDVSSAYLWNVMDSAREPTNFLYKPLNPSSAAVEDVNVNYATDFLANGFKKRAADNQSNRNGDRYIYLAIGDAYPYVNAF